MHWDSSDQLIEESAGERLSTMEPHITGYEFGEHIKTNDQSVNERVNEPLKDMGLAGAKI